MITGNNAKKTKRLTEVQVLTKRSPKQSSRKQK